ncbi:hypothetical protein [Marinobacter sp. SS21]|uniref:hypothetical protein n=1 Tax=Marinobacter sp. SS21 TaxID=2979460 RepID=UPI00232A8E2C|nr:hypothetical protein [Marinobacter sp. SS21]MDC0664358.1 hypothetical protein [Marinobacter sp. SS21]
MAWETVNAVWAADNTERYRCYTRTLNDQGGAVAWHYSYVRPESCTSDSTVSFCQTAQPEECLEIGEYYNPEDQSCTPTCPSGGSLGSYCLSEPEPSCTSSSADFQGTIGWGDDHRPVCTGETTCGENERFAFGETLEGAWKSYCIDNDANPPVCPGGWDSVLLITDNGFACGETNEDASNPDKHDSSDGDSDGDGQADDNGMANQLQDIKGLLGDGNKNTGNIHNAIGNLGTSINNGLGDVINAIGQIPGGGGGSGSGQTEIVGEDGNAISWSGNPITMEIDDGLEELSQVQGEYDSLISNIRSQIAASFGSFTGAGSLQDNNISLWGVDINAGLSKFAPALSMIGSIILFAASFIAIGILMGGRD